ncbi:MAG TPA: hypothetical protein VGQ31_10970 [Candidatus Limnocylindrales bacterium]|nr:hypothetical protein [Candidatus Limnocylindrales bacterium]
MRHRSSALILAVTLVAACSSTPAASDASNPYLPSASVAGTTTSTIAASSSLATPAASLDPEVARAIDFRRTFDLRFDLAFVTASLHDPAASSDPFGVPVYPDEATKLYADLADQDATIPIVVDYASGHANESGGVYIDRAVHPAIVTSLWTAHLAEHAAALGALLHGHPTAVRLVRYTQIELEAMRDRVESDIDWMEEVIPARMQSLGIDIVENVVTMDVSSAEPTAVRQIEDHYRLGDSLVVTSDGTGAVYIPRGVVKVKIRTADGRIPRAVRDLNIDYVYDPNVPGQCGDGVGIGFLEDGTTNFPCQAGRRTLVIFGVGADGGNVEVGRKTVTVIAGKTIGVTIRVRNP